MRSTFKVLFYTKNQSVKNGKAPIMGRITINGTLLIDPFSRISRISVSR